MRIFVAGGTGVLGRRAVPAMVGQGHDVTVLVRSADGARTAQTMGARPVEVGLFDPGPLRAAVAGHDVVVNLATSIPPYSRAAWPAAWALNDRIRTEGSRNLVDAAIVAGAGRYVQESITFLYADGGPAWIGEDHPLRTTPVTVSAAVAEDNAARMADHGAAVVLRFAVLYGHDSGHTVAAVRLARLGLGSMPGPRAAFVSSVTTDDAAAAVVAATTVRAGTYNVVEDEPVTREEYDGVLAVAVGRDRLRPMPGVVERLTGDRLDHITRSHRIANRALREATGWRPRYRGVREGLPVVVAAVRDEPGDGTRRRLRRRGRRGEPGMSTP